MGRRCTRMAIVLGLLAPALSCRDTAESGLPAGEAPPASTVYFGDPHVHTGVSEDGCSADLGEIDASCNAFSDIVDFAVGQGLTWFVLTDHVNGEKFRTAAGAEDDWRRTVDAALSASGVLVLPGAEVFLETASDPLGHRSVFFFADALPGLQRVTVGPSGVSSYVDSCAAVQAWTRDLEARFGPVLLVPHHPAAPSPMPTDWDCLTENDAAVEVYSQWGNSLRVGSAAQPWASYDAMVGDAGSRDPAAGTVYQALTKRRDHPLGFMAGTDHHDTTPGAVCTPWSESKYGGGLTGVALPEGVPLSRASLFEAIKARHTYATTGPRVPVEVAVFDASGAYVGGMGDLVDRTGRITFRVTVDSPEVWDDELRGVTTILPVGGDPETDVRRALVRVAPGVFEGVVDVPGGASTHIPVYVELLLDGPNAHPPGCVDEPVGQAVEATERVWTSPTWFGPPSPG
ncbi:hypothetical protein LBMAG42_21770 [Deltaproteobacteria bacterium]|nr:hypothetical protein LBMAG42_21770 [Deltaproteobacteria bacterium]